MPHSASVVSVEPVRCIQEPVWRSVLRCYVALPRGATERSSGSSVFSHSKLMTVQIFVAVRMYGAELHTWPQPHSRCASGRISLVEQTRFCVK